ncbi:MAG: cytidine deaminase [Prevotellaceae bacterium]|jgi:cytidine deaminase|nr:cytidine deaminase [Prevotellaceae bacterium]
MKQFNIVIPVKICSIDELDETDRRLVTSAFDACKTSYAPFSHFNVGAAALLANGETVTGSNQENVAFPSGLCAERVAVFYANSRFPNVPIVSLAVTSAAGGIVNQKPVYPCGACRQTLLQNELRFNHKIKMLMAGAENITVVESVRDLLPLSFEVYELF